MQLAADAIIVSAFVFLTGGVASYFSSLYALPIIAASTLQSRRGGMLVAILSALLYAGLVLGAVHRRPLAWRQCRTCVAAAAARLRDLHGRPQRVRVLRGGGR